LTRKAKGGLERGEGEKKRKGSKKDRGIREEVPLITQAKKGATKKKKGKG